MSRLCVVVALVLVMVAVSAGAKQHTIDAGILLRRGPPAVASYELCIVQKRRVQEQYKTVQTESRRST